MLNPVQIIEKKRDGISLSSDEIEYFVTGAIENKIPNYQISAWLMATYFNGMTAAETAKLTEAMAKSGQILNLSGVSGIKVDKHSTGGVGDKVSIILAPLAASCGLKVPMMAGRGLGHSGGTLDKLESIPGFTVDLDERARVEILNQIGCIIVGQTQQIAPADRLFYALRDVTGTVASIPLIVASILSKKKAEGTQKLVMDIKVGNGAFMTKQADAKKLAKLLISVGKKLDLQVSCLLTDMNQPLGYAAGNSLEIIECIDVLNGSNSRFSDVNSTDLRELTIKLCAEMLQLAGKIKTTTDARKLATKNLDSGAAWKIFIEMVRAQGGDSNFVENPERLPLATNQKTVLAPNSGTVSEMNTRELGWICVDLGGGRHKTTDTIDPGVGLVFHKKCGQKVTKDAPLVTVFYNDSSDFIEISRRISESIKVSKTRKKVPPLVYESIK